jgi:hypothetical protein
MTLPLQYRLVSSGDLFPLCWVSVPSPFGDALVLSKQNSNGSLILMSSYSLLHLSTYMWVCTFQLRLFGDVAVCTDYSVTSESTVMLAVDVSFLAVPVVEPSDLNSNPQPGCVVAT